MTNKKGNLYIYQLPLNEQRVIEKKLKVILLEQHLTKGDYEEALKDALDSKFSDIAYLL